MLARSNTSSRWCWHTVLTLCSHCSITFYTVVGGNRRNRSHALILDLNVGIVFKIALNVVYCSPSLIVVNVGEIVKC